MKTCTVCKETKELNCFYTNWNNQRNKRYIRAMCKECDKAQVLKSHYANKEDRNKASKAWHHSNKETANAKRRERYHNEDVETRKAKRRKHYLENKAAYLFRSSSYKKHVRRATPSWADLEYIRDIYLNVKEAENLFREAGLNWKFHVDHIIPLRGKLVSGLHVEDNLQVLSATENLSKNNRYEVI
jgi:hypothetical protein